MAEILYENGLAVKTFLGYIDMKKEIGNKIKAARLGILPKMNQASLGIMALGYDPSDTNAAQRKISKIESGSQDINIDELVRIAEVLNIAIDDLVGGVKIKSQGGEAKKMADENWELKMVLESINKRLDALHDRHEALIKLFSRQKDEVSKLCDFGLELQREVGNVNHALDEINERLARAADKGDMQSLKKTGGAGN